EVTVGLEQDNVELLDAALLLHPSADAHCLVEHFEPASLATRASVAPADEQHAISHANPSGFAPAPAPSQVRRLSHRRLPNASVSSVGRSWARRTARHRW